MLDIVRLNNNKVVQGTIKDIASNQVIWINAINPKNEELKSISKKTNIPLENLKKRTGSRERPKTYEYATHSIIVFGCPIKTDAIQTLPISIFIDKNSNIITVFDKKLPALERIKSKIIKENRVEFFKDTTDFLYNLLSEIVDEYFLINDRLEEQIEDLEETVIKHPEKINIEDIINIKKPLIYLHKNLTANREVITAIEKQYVKEIKANPKFREIYNDIIQLIDLQETNREILTGLLETHISVISKNQNEILKKLTVYATFILIPTLISGIYGMNFKYMPELQWELGYPFAYGLMILSIAVSIIYFKRKNWF